MFFTQNYDKYNTPQMKDKAMQYLFKDKIESPLRGKYLAKEIEFKDVETDLNRRTSSRQLVTGSCFTFVYNNRNVLSYDGQDKIYMDVIPLVFVLDPFFRNEYSMCVTYDIGKVTLRNVIEEEKNGIVVDKYPKRQKSPKQKTKIDLMKAYNSTLKYKK